MRAARLGVHLRPADLALLIPRGEHVHELASVGYLLLAIRFRRGQPNRAGDLFPEAEEAGFIDRHNIIPLCLETKSVKRRASLEHLDSRHTSCYRMKSVRFPCNFTPSSCSFALSFNSKCWSSHDTTLLIKLMCRKNVRQLLITVETPTLRLPTMFTIGIVPHEPFRHGKGKS